MRNCKYCGGNCPNDEENSCDGYSGDIDQLYADYKYDHIIHILLQKHGWVRVPWFVSLREYRETYHNVR
jgi:hypothetical protein